MTNFSEEDRHFMQMAIQLSVDNVDNGGGPFGRNACAKLGTFMLDGCTVYTSCEPCPMCLSALYWARVKRICYANTKADAAEIEFDDSFIYDQLDLPYEKRAIQCDHFMRNEALVAFKKWAAKMDKTCY